MYKKIMVPLDGSEVAECVIPHVETFITGCQVSSIILVRVIEPSPPIFDDTASINSATRDKMIESIKKIEEERKSSTAAYLQDVVQRLKHPKVDIKTEIIVGSVADSLAGYTETNAIDLIIIATHGRSGVSRWVRGSVADRILRAARVPVLMVRAPGTTNEMKEQK
jgi:nucleotide-binding universal stress UspA family protein